MADLIKELGLYRAIRPDPPTNIRHSPIAGVDGVKTWGGGAPKSTVLGQSSLGSFTTEDEEKFETQRKYDVVRVMNPDDEDQYVETEVMTEYQARNKIGDEASGKLFTLKYGSPAATKNTKIISRGNVRNSGG